MTTRRTLRLDLAAGWPREGDTGGTCAWALLADGRVIDRGTSEASGWPAADETEAIVSADEVSWLAVTLPQKLGRDARRIVAYAVEDKLLDAPEAMHLVVRRSAGSGGDSVLAIARSRLQEIRDGIAAAGRRLDRLFVDMQLAPCAPGEWTLCRHGTSAFLRTGNDRGLAVDWPDAAPPDALVLALRQAQAAGDAPGRIAVAAAPAPDAAAWTAALGVPVMATPAFDALTASTAAAGNLLTDAFAPPADSALRDRRLRLALVVLLFTGLAHTLLSLGDWAWLAWQASTLRAESVAIYRTAVPAASGPLLDPSLQLQRATASVLRERGRVGKGELLTMLAAFADALPAEARIHRLSFDASVLEVVAVLPDKAAAALGDTLRLHGYRLDAKALQADAAGTEYSLRMGLR